MIELKEYQKEAIKIVEDKFNLGLNRTCIIWPTGLGKTIVPIELMKNHPNQRFLIIAPKHSILKQTRGYMEEEKVSSENAMFYTYSGLSKMKEEVMKKLNPDYIVLDEMHRAGAKEWGKGVDRLLETYSEAKLLGLTATPTRMDGKNVAEEKFNGDIAHQITLEEAIARGLLKMPKSYINAIYLLNGEIGDIEKSIEKIQDKEERGNLTQKLEKVKRKLEESKGLGEIFSERMSNKKGKYIIFCKDIEHMHKMQEKSEEWFKGVNETMETYSISIEKTPLQNSRELRHFKENNNESLKLLYSVEMFNEGLHIENDGIIMLRPTASWIIYLQQLGRTLGIQESGEVFDIVNNSRSSKDIYQFYEAVKRIQKREKVEGVNIDFTIYDEIREISELLEEITASIHIDKFSFEEKIAELKKLKEKGEDLSKIKRKDKTEDRKPKGTWIVCWREDYKKGKLTKEQIKQITELGIDLEPQKGKKFSNAEKIAELGKLKEKGEDLSKIKREDKTEDGKPIGKWVKTLKEAYKKGKLTEEEIKQITELGIDLEAQRRQTSIAEKIAEFRKLKEQGEDLSEIIMRDKTKDGKPIGNWIIQLRQDYKKGKLTEEEIKQITELGIDLEPQTGKKFSNAEKIAEFRKLKEQGEDLSEIIVSDKTKDGKPIGNWVTQLRQDYKKGKLTEEEIKQITELGIDLEAQRRQTSIAEKMAEFRKLKEQGEDLSQTKGGKLTRNGISQLRGDYKKGKLTKEEIEQITELGIDLEPQTGKKFSNAEKIAEFRKLKEQGEDLSEISVRDKTKDGKPIGRWVSQLRGDYKKGKLTKEEIEQITELGIPLSLKDRKKAKNSAKIKLEEAEKLCKKYEELIGENKELK